MAASTGEGFMKEGIGVLSTEDPPISWAVSEYAIINSAFPIIVANIFCHF